MCQIAKQFVAISLALTLLGGCATSSVFSSYPSQIATIKQQIDNNKISLAATQLEGYRDDKDKILFLMERGRALQIGNSFTDSLADYRQATEEIAALDLKAVISLSDTASQTAALLTNDNAIPYQGESYERVFLYHFQAMNYLFFDQLESAMVEVRRANEEQQLAAQKHESEIAKIEQQNRQALRQNRSLMNSFENLDHISARVKNSFQNAYTFYASGVLWELNDKPNDAYIDYKKALKIMPGNRYLQKDVLRLATALGMKNDLARFKKTFSIKSTPAVKGDGELIIFFEQGFAPVKQQIKIPVFTRDRLHSVAFPSYRAVWNTPRPLIITDTSNGARLGTTSPIVYVQALATKALQENLPGIMTRQILRVIAKNETAHKARSADPVAGLGVAIFNLVTEQADLRSWLTLPNDAHIYRGTLASGKFNLKLASGAVSRNVQIKIVPGKKTILRIISTGSNMYTYSITL